MSETTQPQTPVPGCTCKCVWCERGAHCKAPPDCT